MWTRLLVLLSRCRAAITGRRLDQDFDEELKAHLTMATDENIRWGLSPAIGEHRFRTVLLSSFAGVALFLAAIGIYGVLAYFVSQRSRELGIRLALGAHPVALFRLVVGQGLRPVVVGAVVGIAGALAVTSVAQSLLFGVEPIDPISYSVAIGLLGTIAVAACAMPALRAMRVDPLVALRDE